MPLRVLTLDVFLSRFAAEFQLPLDALSEHTRLIEDLGFDSFELFRVMIFLEMLTPVDLPEDLSLESLTLRMVYDFYVAEAARPDHERYPFMHE